jgi:hypothetical protein
MEILPSHCRDQYNCITRRNVHTRLPVIIGMLALALILSLDCIKKYRETKVWLDDNAEKGKELKKENEL